MPVDFANDICWYQFGAFKVRFPSGIIGLSQSRPFLEAHLRRRVLALRNVDCLTECEVTGLLASGDWRCIVGVRVRDRRGGIERAVPAALVVDATGRGSKSPKWLEELGYSRPRESRISTNVGYASRTYRRRSGDLDGAKMLVMLATPPHETRGGALVPIEDDRWMASLAGLGGDHPPPDESGFLAFARSLPIPELYHALVRTEPLTQIAIYKFPASVRQHYDEMERFPEGYLVLGDALCSFNPVYGQGMTVSALEAEVLDECLRHLRRGADSLVGLAPRFFQTVSPIIDRPWKLATAADVRYASVEGPRSLSTAFFDWYVRQLHRVTAYDPDVYSQFIRVINLMESPSSLLRPPLSLRVLTGSLTNRGTRRRVA